MIIIFRAKMRRGILHGVRDLPLLCSHSFYMDLTDLTIQPGKIHLVREILRDGVTGSVRVLGRCVVYRDNVNSRLRLRFADGLRSTANERGGEVPLYIQDRGEDRGR